MFFNSSYGRIVKYLLIIFALAPVVLTRPVEGFVLYDQQTNSFSTSLAELQANRYQQIIDLAGACEYRVDDEKRTNTCWMPFSYQGEHVVMITKSFNLPDSLKFWSVQLYIPEINYTVQVWVNGSFVASFTGSHLGYSCEISQDHLRFGGQNELMLKVDNRLSPTETLPLYPQLLHPQNYGGIFSGIYLRCIPSWSVEDVFVDYSFEKDTVISEISLKAQLSRHAISGLSQDKIKSKIKLSIQILDSTGQVVSNGQSEEIERKNNEDFQVNFSLAKFNPVLWGITKPVQYRVIAYLTAGSDTLHQYESKIGFKSVRVDKRELLLNGQKLKLHGIDYIPESKYGGRVMTVNEYKEDLARMKDIGINAIRLPFLAPPPEFVNLTDEMGFILFVEGGIDWIPSDVINSLAYRKLVENSFNRLVSAYKGHVSIFGWGIGSLLDYRNSNTVDFVNWLRQEIKRQDNRPCYLEVLNTENFENFSVDFVLQSQPIFENDPSISAPSKIKLPLIVSRVGYLARRGVSSAYLESGAIVKQADYLLRQIKQLDGNNEINGYFLHTFSDYRGTNSLLAQPNGTDPYLYSYGIVRQNREERISYTKLRDLAQAGLATPLTSNQTSENSPNAFPIAGLAAVLLLSVELRRNNIFRQNLKRVFMHPHGFFMDIRYRRFLQASQPMLLWLIESLTLALLLSSILYYFRYRFGLDYFLTHILVKPELKTYLASIIWDPIRSTSYLTGLFMMLILIKAFIIKLLSFPFRETVDFWQAFNYLLWAWTPILFLSPLAVIFYRVLASSKFTMIAYLVIIIGILWCLVRLLMAIRTGYSTSSAKVYGLVFTVFVALTLTGFILMNNKLATMSYYEYYQHVFSKQSAGIIK